MKKAKIPATFRLPAATLKTLRKLAKRLELSQAQVVEMAVEKLEVTKP